MDKLKGTLTQALDQWAQGASKSLFNALWPLFEASARANEKQPEEAPKTLPKSVPQTKTRKLRKMPERPAPESDEEVYQPIPLKPAVRKTEQSDNPPPITDVKKGGALPGQAEAPITPPAAPASAPHVAPHHVSPRDAPIAALALQASPSKSADEEVGMDLEETKSTPVIEAKVEAKIEPKVEKPISSDNESIDSDINKDLFGSDEDEDEDESKPKFKGLKRTEENLNFLLESLEKYQGDDALLGEVLGGLEDIFKTNFDQTCMNLLAKTEAPGKLRSMVTDEKDLKRRARQLNKYWIEACRRLTNPDNGAEDWGRLEKRLQTSVQHKNDQEILAALRRIGDSFPAQLTRELRAEMKPLMKTVKEAARLTKHSEVQLKVKNLVARYKDKTVSTEEESKQDQINRSRQLMNKKLTQITESSKLLAENDERSKRGTLTADIGPTKKRKR